MQMLDDFLMGPGGALLELLYRVLLVGAITMIIWAVAGTPNPVPYAIGGGAAVALWTFFRTL
jgi:hypothetical protein